MSKGSSKGFAGCMSRLLMLFATSAWFFANAQCSLKPGQSKVFADSCSNRDNAFQCCGFECTNDCSSLCCWNSGSGDQQYLTGGTNSSTVRQLRLEQVCYTQHPGRKKSLGSYTGKYEAFEYVNGAYLITEDQTHKDLFDGQPPQGDTYMCSVYANGGWGADRARCCGCGAADPLVATRRKMFAPGPSRVKYNCYYGCERVDCGSVVPSETTREPTTPPEAATEAPTWAPEDPSTEAPLEPTTEPPAQCSIKPGQSDFFADSCSSRDNAFQCCGFECRDAGHGCSAFCCWNRGISGQEDLTPAPWRPPPPPPGAAAPALAPEGTDVTIPFYGFLVFICCCCFCCCYYCFCRKTQRTLLGDDDDDEEESDVELPDSARCPSYWMNQDLSEDFDERYEEEELVPIVQQMLDTTWKDIVTRDRKGGKPDRLEVVSVQRFEDSTMWAAYLGQKEKIKMRGQLQSILELDGDLSKGHVLTDGFVRYLTHGQQLDQHLNEHYLFHGTSPSAAENIAESGFRINLAGSNAGTMFGKGAYFAECSSKSDEYAVSGAGAVEKLGFRGFSQEDDEFAILVCRVTCGKMFRALRGSDKSEIIPRVKQGEIDGVLGDREASVGTYREFVVFKEAQVYPEYRVLYRRVYDDEDVE